VKRDAWEDVFGDVIDEFQTGVWIAPTQLYGERFFTGSSVPTRRLSLRIPSILNALVGRPVRTIEGGRERTYSIKDVRTTAPCAIEIQDVTRLNDPGNTSQWWSEEDIQSFSLGAVRASLTPEGTVSRLTVRADTPTIRLERAFLSSNGWNDFSLPRNGSAVEFVDRVIFDLPPGSDTNRAFESFRSAITECSRR
jgi:hypothetical protein